MSFAAAGLAVAAIPSAAVAATPAPLPAPAVSSIPAMTPAFDPAVLDYSVTCPDGSVRLTAKSPNGVSVGWGTARARAGNTLVSTKLTPGKRTTFLVENRSRGRLVKRTTYSVRCQPADLPVLTATATGNPSVDWVLMVPRPNPFLGASSNYIVMYDRRGTPVWWYRTVTNATEVEQVDSSSIVHFEELQPNPFQGGSFGRWIVRGLDGTVKATVQPPGVLLDQHDIARTSSGSWLTIAYERRDGVNLRSLGGSSNSTVFDGVVREVSPANQVLWTWKSATKTTPGVTGGLERPIPLRDGSGEAYDLVHANSVSANGSDSAIVSLRAYDVVLNVSRKTGETLWQLGGRSTPERLTVIGDPETRPLVGQHDARLLADGTLSVFDNGTTKDGFVRAPRAVRYRIDPAAKTATFISQITDPAVPKSSICGSYRVLPSGNALIDWGGTRRITETTPDGTVVLTLILPQSQILAYRAVPVSESSISRKSLHSAMDKSLGGPAPPARQAR